MSAAVRVFLGISAMALTGLAASSFFSRDLRRTERAAWALAAGLLIQSAVILLLDVVRPAPRLPFLLAAGALLAVFAVLAARRRRSRNSPVSEPIIASHRAAPAPVAWILLAAALLAWIVFLVSAVAEPMWATDYLAIWGLKGKTIFETGGLSSRFFRDPALYWAHLEYPLLVPLSLAALASIAGEWNDRALALLYPATALATLLGIFGFLARRATRTSGAAAMLLAALCFPLYNPVNAGTAEVVFAFGAVLAACAFLDVARRDSSEARARVFVAALFCASAKQEGTLWIALLGILYLSGRRGRFWRRETALAGAAFGIPPAAHWMLLLLLRGPQTPRDFDFHFFEPGSWAALAHRFAGVLTRIASTEAREAAVALAAIGLFLLLTRRSFADALLPALLVQVLFYCLAFSVSSFDPMYAVDAAFRRLVLTLFPVLALVLGARLAGVPGLWRAEELAVDCPVDAADARD